MKLIQTCFEYIKKLIHINNRKYIHIYIDIDI